jgi:hypothetical protein
MSATALAASQGQIKVIYDPLPDVADILREARFAGTKPDSGSTNSRSGVSFRTVTDLKDYGPLRNIIPNDIHAISVRYYDSSFTRIQEVQTYLTSVLQSGKGTTNAFCPWSEMLPVPALEATVQFTSGRKGKWLLWRYGRSVYRDPDMKWWFSYGW